MHYKTIDLYRKQYILTRSNGFDLPWDKVNISNYKLYVHPELEYEEAGTGDFRLYLLGFLYDHKQPDRTNRDIITGLASFSEPDRFLDELAKYSGHFVIIYRNREKIIILNDAGAQKEVYYDDGLTTIASTPRLTGRIVNHTAHKSPEAIKFYSSHEFKRRKEYIGQTTHVSNIRHLIANHYLDLTEGKVIRYFPRKKINPVSISDASLTAREMLSGFIRAASMRKGLAMGVTGGYDSRTLFLASRDINCKYYVSRLGHMTDSHYDITVPERLTRAFNKDFEVIRDREDLDEQDKLLMEKSIDFPRYPKKLGEFFNGHMIINGSLSEIARNVFEYHKNVNGKDLAYIYGYYKDSFVENEYQKWIDESIETFNNTGYNILDMFYWEERIANWAAKTKTEMSSLGRDVYSPYTSHYLLETLLSTPRKMRDRQKNKLYNLMINEFAPEVYNIPVNPTLKTQSVKIMKTAGLYNISQKIRLKLRLRPPWYH